MCHEIHVLLTPLLLLLCCFCNIFLQLSAIDASPLLLKTLNSPALKFDHALDLDRLHQATAALLLEYPIVGGRYVQPKRHTHLAM
jgi:hypothetical protein